VVTTSRTSSVLDVVHFPRSGEGRRVARGGTVPYRTVVEFEWDGPGPRATFESLTSGGDAPVEGRLVRILGHDDHGARAIEVWDSPEDARRFAESSAPSRDTVELLAPTRVFGFEVTSFNVG
jgi:hypothetical protein